MNKLFLIIQREYFSRVKKKSFLIMTILGPLLMAGLMIVPVWLAMRDQTEHQISAERVECGDGGHTPFPLDP